MRIYCGPARGQIPSCTLSRILGDCSAPVRPLSRRSALLDERRYRATLVTGDPLELRPDAGLENDLSGQLGGVFVFQMTLAPARLLLGRLISGKQGSPSCTASCTATLSNCHDVLRCTKQVEITLADPVFDPHRQIGRKFFWCPEQLISGTYGMIFCRTRCSGQTQGAKPLLLSKSRPVCTAELADPTRHCSVARRIGAAVFDVLDERAQLGQDLTSARVV